jgi:hypothetical protein
VKPIDPVLKTWLDEAAEFTPEMWRASTLYMGKPVKTDTSGAAWTTSADPAFTARKLKETEKLLMSTIPAFPRWTQTTLQWLRENWPMYTSISGRPAEERLHAALRSMSYLKAEHDHAGATMKDYSALLDELVAGWNKTEHDKLRAFLAEGGYAARKAHYDALDKKDEALEAEVADETLAQLDEAEREFNAAQEAEDELKELISTELREQDPRAGQW